MFIQNKYTRIYYNIINCAKDQNRSKSGGYFENHHIIPKSVGGTDNASNLVLLTAREHFICHHLLTKITSGTSYRSMLYAFNMMLVDSKNNNKYSFSVNKKFESYKKRLIIKLSKSRQGKTFIDLFGKERALAIKIKQSTPVTVSSKHYISKSDACIDLGISMYKLNKLLKDPAYKPTVLKGMSFIDRFGTDQASKIKNRMAASKTGTNSPNAIPITVNGKHYNSKLAACTDLNLNWSQLNQIYE